ncbi:MAG: glycosyl hydrolase [Alteromonadaceae bacterium]|nr:MAG: glycosyl hydrolase [Alteromonadaceae bacterium]
MKIKYLLLALAVFSVAACTSKDTKPHTSASNAESNQRSLEQRTTNIEGRIDALIAQMTLEEKVSLLHGNTKFSVASIERLGIHEMWMSDGPHGVRHEINRHGWSGAGWTNDHSSYLPHLTSVAASWNRRMATLHGDVLGSEARHRGKDLILGPGINLARLPLYGRNFEYMGEDPYLAGKLSVAEIKAIQANDVAATVKHYALNTQELNRAGHNAKPDERTLRELYLPAFEESVKEGGVYAIMGAYNSYYGDNANQSKHLIMDILKGEWGYQGLVVTDWGSDINTYDAAVNGLDIEMGTGQDDYNNYFLAQPLIDMVNDGKVPLSVVDDKVRRILRVQIRIGMMDKSRLAGERNTAKHQSAAREIASEGIVLLKNDAQLLPLQKKKLKNILVMGPNTDKKHASGGGSSQIKALYEITPLQGLKEYLGDDVDITVMRARSSTISPIAGDYILTRHWTGTPAWNLLFYSDASHKEQIKTASIPASQYSPAKGEKEYVTLTAEVAPTDSGIHTLKIAAIGKFKVFINGKMIFERNSHNKDIITHDVTLNGKQKYWFELHYEGEDGLTLGWNAPGNPFDSEEKYLAAAKAADAVLYFGGLSHNEDREAIDRMNMTLPDSQDEIISKLLEVNDNTVIFMVAGSAVEMPWVDKAKTLVWGWYGGMEAGNAFAEVLFGDVNPGGKMPITLPVKLEDTSAIALDDYHFEESTYPDGVFIGYRWLEKQNIKPMFPFGHGLSYTTFSYANIQLSDSRISGDDTLTVTAKITNTGKVAGAEVVQLYLNDKIASVPRPKKELKGFDKVFLDPGESKTVSMTIKKRDLSFWDINSHNWLAEAGEFEVMLGASISDIRLRESFQYQ